MTEVRWAQQALSGNESEERFGYSQAIMQDGLILVSGQVGRDPRSGELIGPPELAVRITKAFSNIRASVAQLSKTARLIAINIYLPMSYGSSASTLADTVPGLLQGDAPAASIIPIKALFNPDYLVEVSAVASSDPVDALPDDGPIGQMLASSRGVRVGSQIHVSGQLPVDDTGDIQGTTVAEQLEVALARLAETLRGLGADLGDVWSSQLFVAGQLSNEEMAAMTAVHVGAFGAAKPASTLVFVPELPLGARVQIVAVANTARSAGD